MTCQHLHILGKRRFEFEVAAKIFEHTKLWLTLDIHLKINKNMVNSSQVVRDKTHTTTVVTVAPIGSISLQERTKFPLPSSSLMDVPSGFIGPE